MRVGKSTFFLSNWGAEQFSSDIYGRNFWGSPTDSNADFAWLQHMVLSMDKKKGRCAVVLPQGVLFRGGKEGEIRQKLILSDKLECVISLVSNLFYGAGVSACILLLNNNKVSEHKGKVCLIDGTEIYTPRRAKNILTDDDVNTLFNLYANYVDVLEKCKIVSIEDLKEKGYTLQVNAYIDRASPLPIQPEIIRQEFRDALMAVYDAENSLYQLLKKEDMFMSERITQRIEAYKRSAVLLHNNIDAGSYKQYIFPLLFKRICMYLMRSVSRF